MFLSCSEGAGFMPARFLAEKTPTWFEKGSWSDRILSTCTVLFTSIYCTVNFARILAHFLTRTRGLGTDGQLICASLFLILASLYLGPRDPMLTENMCCLALLTISAGWNATWWGYWVVCITVEDLHHPASLLWNAQVIVSKYKIQ